MSCNRRNNRNLRGFSRFDVDCEPEWQARRTRRHDYERSYQVPRDRGRRSRSRSRSRDRSRGNPFIPSGYKVKGCHRAQQEPRQDGRKPRYTAGLREKNEFTFPTEPRSTFTQALSSIVQGTGVSPSGQGELAYTSNDNFKDYLTQALAAKLNIKSAQQVNEKSLLKILNDKGSAADLKQAVQARAAVYGSLLDPCWFVKNLDLSSKIKDLKGRRSARATLMGAVLFIAQAGLNNINSILGSGDSEILERLDPTSIGSAAQFKKAVTCSPPLQLLKFANEAKFNVLNESLCQLASDLDYLQSLTTSLSNETSLNPSMNAVCDAFSRRRTTRRFRSHGQSVELDTLLNQSRKGKRDDDALPFLSNSKPGYSFKSTRTCFRFQEGTCSFPSCRFRHQCSVCNSRSHGSRSCTGRAGTTLQGRIEQQPPATTTSSTSSRPPHPRFRRDRERDRVT